MGLPKKQWKIPGPQSAAVQELGGCSRGSQPTPGDNAEGHESADHTAAGDLEFESVIRNSYHSMPPRPSYIVDAPLGSNHSKALVTVELGVPLPIDTVTCQANSVSQ